MTSEVEELKGKVISKVQQLEKLKGGVVELEKAQDNSTKKISNLKVEIKYIERQ